MRNTLQPLLLSVMTSKDLSMAEIGHIWTDGNEVNIKFRLSKEYESLMLEMEYWIYGSKQEVLIYANAI